MYYLTEEKQKALLESLQNEEELVQIYYNLRPVIIELYLTTIKLHLFLSNRKKIPKSFLSDLTKFMMKYEKVKDLPYLRNECKNLDELEDALNHDHAYIETIENKLMTLEVHTIEVKHIRDVLIISLLTIKPLINQTTNYYKEKKNEKQQSQSNNRATVNYLKLYGKLSKSTRYIG